MKAKLLINHRQGDIVPTQTIPSLSEQLRRLDFIMGAVTRGLTYKEASALWADGIDQLYDRMVD